MNTINYEGSPLVDKKAKTDVILGAVRIFLGSILIPISVFLALYQGKSSSWIYWIIAGLWAVYVVATSVTLYYSVSISINRARIEEIDRNLKTLDEIRKALQ